MTDALRFFVAGPAVPKARARVGRGHAYTPERTAAWEQCIALAFRQAFPDHEPWGRDVCVGIDVEVLAPGRGPRARIRGDASNLQKAVEDALNEICYVDDIQIVDSHASKRRVTPGETPGVIVKLWRV